MSRYLLLILLNAPFIIAGILSTITVYKLKKSTGVRFAIQLTIWLIFLAGLLAAEPLYTWLYANGLTDTNSLSLFDVIQITAIVALFYVVSRMSSKLETLETRVQDLHQELSIRLSK